MADGFCHLKNLTGHEPQISKYLSYCNVIDKGMFKYVLKFLQYAREGIKAFCHLLVEIFVSQGKWPIA